MVTAYLCGTNPNRKGLSMINTNGLNHIALQVNDLEQAAAFYTDLFNMEVTRRTDSMTFLKTIGATDMIALNRSEAKTAPGKGMVHFGFIVEPAQFDAALATIEVKATPIVSGPGTRGEGRYVFIEDPDGYTVEIFECLAPAYQ
jgi:catechol 2,3-dioxygenase-like lactoylglutathione lyase family enzyme